MKWHRLLVASYLALLFLLGHPAPAGAQPFPDQFGQRGPEIPPEVVGIYVAVALVAVVIGLAITIVIAVLISSCYARIPQQYREMEPGMVYLMLIPCFNLVWIFFVTLRLSQSFQKYFADIGRSDVGDCGYQLGLWCSICTVVSVIPCVNYVAGPAALVLLILYLVKVIGLKNQIPVATVG
ncbi:MAG TPA: hypothetical protein VG826_01460 [Pirellulales bacterium]|nr:hypothetical protein [Pirellulales bacterium]